MRPLVAIVLLVAAVARAAPPREARQHFDRGTAAYQAGRWQEAVDEFQRAYELSRYPDILLDIARAETHLGREQTAIGYLERYLEQRPDAEDAPSVRAEVAARKKAIADNARAAQAKEEAERAQKRAQQAEEARRAEAKRAAAERRDEALARRRRARGVAIALIAVGVASAGAGLACGLFAQHESDVVTSGTGAFNPTFADAERTGSTLAPLGLALDAVGAAIAVAGVALLVWSLREPPLEQVWLSPSTNGFVVGGRF